MPGIEDRQEKPIRWLEERWRYVIHPCELRNGLPGCPGTQSDRGNFEFWRGTSRKRLKTAPRLVVTVTIKIALCLQRLPGKNALGSLTG